VTDAIDALGIECCHVIGHSMGALIALELAATRPERIGRLALLGAAPRMSVHPELLRAAASDLPRAASMIAAWGLGGPAQLTGSATPGVCLPSAARTLLETSRPGVLAADLEACHAYARGEERAASVRSRTLVLGGEHDRMTPVRQGERLARLIPGAVTARLAAGHMLMLEQPGAALDAIAGFLLEA
jgi:pimeloyl-ACP methyl ester carboxylesterase